MKKIMYEAGKLVGDTFEAILKNKEIKPKYVAFEKDGTVTTKEFDSNLEVGISEAVDLINENPKKSTFATAVFPAEMANRNRPNQREKIVLAMIYDYDKEFFLNITIPYELKDGKLELKKCDWLNIKGVLRRNLSDGEEAFKKGISENGSSKEFWKEGICY